MCRLRKIDFLEQITARAVRDHLAARRDIASINDSLVELRSLKAWSRWFSAEHGSTDEMETLPFPRGTKAAPGRIARDDAISKLRGALMRSPKLMGENARDIAIVELLRWTGCRRGEASKLDIGDIDFEQSRIRFRDVKNREERYCPIHPQLSRALRRWIVLRERYRLAAETNALFGPRR